MAIRFVLLGGLRDLTKGEDDLRGEGRTVGEALDSLREVNPTLGDSICDEHGRLREFINVFVGGREVRALKGERTRVKDGESLIIAPSVAGGAQ